MIKQIQFVFALGVFAASATASATQCSTIQSSIASGSCTGSCIVTYQQSHPECFGTTTSTAGASQAIGGTTLQQMLTISNAISTRTASLVPPTRTSAEMNRQTGMAAGNGAGKWNIWASISGDNSRYDGRTFVNNGGNNLRIKSSLNVSNIVLGGDFAISPTTVVGVSAAFDDGSGSSESFVNGASNDGSKGLSTRGYTLAPYAGWQINKNWALDATVGLGRVKMSTSDSLRGSADRMFYGANLNYSDWNGNWQFTGKASYLYGEEKYGNLSSNVGVMGNTASKNKMDQARLSGQAAYWMDGVMPYFGLAYSSDLTRSTSGDAAVQAATADLGKNAWVWSIGANFISLKNSMTGGIAYNQESGRTAGKRDSLMANINVRF